jgi:hypothetical protein
MPGQDYNNRPDYLVPDGAGGYDLRLPGESESNVQEMHIAPKSDPTAISITATFLGQASFNIAEVVAVRHRFDMQQMRSLTDVEIRLRFDPLILSQSKDPPEPEEDAAGDS